MTTTPEEQANLSLAAMEAALKPQVLETLAEIAGHAYDEAAAMQDARMGRTLNEDRQFSADPGTQLSETAQPRSWSRSTPCTCTTTASRP